MERVNHKLNVILQSLTTLESRIILFNEYSELFNIMPNHNNEQLALSMRDAMILRFKCCTDLFWKIIQIYLEDIEKINSTVNAPRVILREAVNARLLSEQEGMMCMDMVESRNKISHMYHVEVAQNIAHMIPEFYTLMKLIIDRIQKNLI